MKGILKRTAALLVVLMLSGCGARSYYPSDIIIPDITDAASAEESAEVMSDEVALPETTESAEQSPVLSREEELLAQMSLEEKVGQLFIGRCPENDGVGDILRYHLGGYILFARDFKDGTPESVRADIAEYQEASEIPLLIGVDEEGGDIVRISKYNEFRSEPFGAPMELYMSGGVSAVIADAQEKCALLDSLGINMNFAPVCDVPRSTADYIYDRTFGTDVQVTAECVSAIVSEMNGCGTISVLKHFPGYGDNVDTHTGIAYDERPLSELRSIDLLPFAAGIEAGAPCVMVSHNIIMSIDDAVPASLSPEVHELLRGELGFEGVIVTDELSMGAIEDFTGGGDAAVLALKAGNDLLCVTDYAASIEAVLTAVENGELTEARIDGSVLRILRMKADYGLLS